MSLAQTLMSQLWQALGLAAASTTQAEALAYLELARSFQMQLNRLTETNNNRSN